MGTEIPYYRYFFSNNQDVITNCYFQLPKRQNWRGHSFYYECLKNIQRMTISLPNQFHELMSTPLWHNRFLETKFDHDLSINGYNFIRDIFQEGILIDENS